MAKPKPDPLDNPYLKARNRAPGAVVTEPRPVAESHGGRVQPATHGVGGGVVSRKGGGFDAFVSRLVAEGRTKPKGLK